jgi:hypothetical protein
VWDWIHAGVEGTGHKKSIGFNIMIANLGQNIDIAVIVRAHVFNFLVPILYSRAAPPSGYPFVLLGIEALCDAEKKANYYDR